MCLKKIDYKVAYEDQIKESGTIADDMKKKKIIDN